MLAPLNHTLIEQLDQVLPPAELEALLVEYSAFMTENASYRQRMMGYPANLVSEPLPGFLSCYFNNLGYPYVEGNHALHSKGYERKVLGFFARMYGLDADNLFGYLATGSTQGVEHGILAGFQKFPRAIAYFSEDAHLCVGNTLEKLRLDYEVVRATPSGEMCIPALQEQLARAAHRPAVVIANIGSTRGGAIDDVAKISEVLNGVGIHERYIHCDAALAGAYLPLLVGAPAPSFERHGIDSISISMHKFLGVFVPSAVFLKRRSDVDDLVSTAGLSGDYHLSQLTMSCSRAGIAALHAAWLLQRMGALGIAEQAQTCLARAARLCDALRQARIPASRNAFSNTVVLAKPSDALCNKWMLPQFADNTTHVVVMPHVTDPMIDAFVADLAARGHEATLHP